MKTSPSPAGPNVSNGSSALLGIGDKRVSVDLLYLKGSEQPKADSVVSGNGGNPIISNPIKIVGKTKIGKIETQVDYFDYGSGVKVSFESKMTVVIDAAELPMSDCK